MSPAPRSSRTGLAPTTRAIALALAGLLAGGGQTTQAAQPAPADKEEAAAARAAKKEASAKMLADAKAAAAKSAAAAEGAANQPIAVVEGGRVVGQKTAEAA